MSDLTMQVRYPGIGGSLGECVICGKSFIAACILGEPVSTFRVSFIEADLPAHDACRDLVMEISKTDKDWRRLPAGPLRTVFERLDAEKVGG